MTTSSIKIAEMAGLVSAMETAKAEIPSDVNAVSGNLSAVWLSTFDPHRADSVAAWVDTELPGVRRRLALARFIEASSPGIQTQVTIDEDDLSTLTPTQAQEQAREAADLFSGMDDGEIPQELLDLLAQHGTDPYFAAEFAKHVSPQELAVKILMLSATRQTMAQGMLSESGLQDVEDFDGDYEALLDLLGTTIGTATFGTGDLAPPADYAQVWLDAITEEYPDQPGQASALGLIISRGTFADTFIGPLAQGFLDYEMTEGERGMWYNRSHTYGDTFGAIDPVHGDDEGAPTGYTDYYDPLTGIMAALSRSPVAGSELFGQGPLSTVEIQDNDVEVNAYLKYVLMERRWPIDRGDGAYAAVAAAMTPYEGGSILSGVVAVDAVNIMTAFEEDLLERTENKNPISELGHLVLDIFGLIPGLGEIADGVNAVWYFAEGDVVNGAISAGAMIPFAGWVASGGKWVKRGENAIDLATLGLRAEDLPALARLEGGPGAFSRVTETMSTRSAAYQSQVTGFPTEIGYVVNGTKFDGFLDGNLLDAKGRYNQFLNPDGSWRSWARAPDDLLAQAQRQTDAAGGTPITWHVMEPEAAAAIQRLMRENGFGNIVVVHTPEVP